MVTDVIDFKTELMINDFLNLFYDKIPTDKDIYPYLRSRLTTNIYSDYYLRDAYNRKYGFSLISQETIDVIKKYDPILEIAAGTGYISKMLFDNRVDVIATELGTKKYEFEVGSLFKIEELEARDAIEKYLDRNILLSWPCYHGLWSELFLPLIKNQYLIYIGEGDGGCCATDEFFSILNKEFRIIEEFSIPKFFGIHDYLTVYKR